jgi:hypothetical protein
MGFLPFEPTAGAAPGELNFVVRVPNAVVRADKMPVPMVTKYKDFPFPQRARNQESWTQDYVFVLNRDGGQTGEGDGGNLMEFVFARKRTLTEMQVPIACETYPTTMPHQWHNVLVRMGFIEDPTQPLTLEVGGQVKEFARVFGRFWKLPGGVYATEALIETFLSAEPFPRSLLKLDVPVPDEVSWQVRNDSGSISCLHPYIRFKETQMGGRVMDGMGTVNDPIVLSQGQDFPATNHETWQTHVMDEDVTKVNGVWKLTRTTVYPPGVEEVENSV